MSGDRFEIEDNYEPRRSSGGGCLKGCLIVGVIMLILGVIAIFWVMSRWKGWVANIGSEAIGGMIDESDWPDQEKVEVKEQVQRVADAFREGDISGDQLGVIIEEILESPLMTTMVVAAVEKKYVAGSGLTDEEKETGRADMRRFVRGMLNKDITEDDLDEAMSHIADKGADGEWKMKESVTDDELRKLFQLVKEKADAAEVPAEVEEIDPSDEMRRIIDKALLGIEEEEPVQPAEPVEPAAEAEPVEPVEPAVEAEPAEPAEPAEEAETAVPVEEPAAGAPAA